MQGHGEDRPKINLLKTYLLIANIQQLCLNQCCVKPRTSRSRPRTLQFFEAKAKDTQADAKATDMQVKAEDIDQEQLAFFRFQYKISKCCGSFGHEIMVCKHFMA